MVVISEIRDERDTSKTCEQVEGKQLQLEDSADDAGKQDFVFISMVNNSNENDNDEGSYVVELGTDSEFETDEEEDDDDDGDEEEEDDDDGGNEEEEEEKQEKELEIMDIDEVNDNGVDDKADSNASEKIDDTPDNDVKPSGMDIIKDVLEKAAKEAKKNDSIAVTKHLDLEYDLGTLLAVDNNELDFIALRDSTDDYLKNLARDNTQLLINHIWELPITRKDVDIVAKLPPQMYKLPREKPIPQPKPLTKWQSFALEKGIKAKKGSRLQWDDALKKWIPRWGYKRAKALKEKQWLIETKKNDDPHADPYAKRRNEKQERVAKNELQRLKNLARANNVKIPRGEKLYKDLHADLENGKKKGKQSLKKKGVKVPRMGLLPPDKMTSEQLKQAVTISRSSTASLGKFQERLPKEKDAKKVKALMPMAKKRRAPNLTPHQEKKENLKIVDHFLKKRPKLDIEKAVNRQINEEQKQRAAEKLQQPKKKGRGKVREKGKSKGKGRGKGSKGITGKAKRKSGGKRKR